MNETQLNAVIMKNTPAKVAASMEYASIPIKSPVIETQPVEVAASTETALVPPQTPQNEMWITIRRAITMAGAVSVVIILALGTRNRAVNFNGTVKDFHWRMSLSRTPGKVA